MKKTKKNMKNNKENRNKKTKKKKRSKQKSLSYGKKKHRENNKKSKTRKMRTILSSFVFCCTLCFFSFIWFLVFGRIFDLFWKFVRNLLFGYVWCISFFVLYPGPVVGIGASQFMKENFLDKPQTVCPLNKEKIKE